MAPISVEKELPTEFKEGESKFNAFCSRCHGAQATGTAQGPPLVHKIYEPNHHADFAFQRAAAQGVKAHHWKFGDMPKIDGVTADDVTQIIGYIRWLQRQAGIF
jgi:cytochrome c2